ncbi:MAG: hypothetical protein M3326_09030 [Actinomycetota bacterium]|nr:hypothetical protein [Actinomycetota bacterium]
MTFHIGSQDAHVINNVAGDQWNQVTLTDDDARDQLRRLRHALEGAGLPPAVSRQARAHLDRAEVEIGQGPESKPAVAERLKQVTQGLVSAGALATAGGAVLGPLGALAGWLGGIGKPVADMLNRNG